MGMKHGRFLGVAAVCASLLACGCRSDPSVLGNERGAYDQVRWSFDGEWIAYRRRDQVWLIKPTGGRAHPITSPREKYPGAAEALAWLPDGKLAFADLRDVGSWDTPEVSLYAYDPVSKKTVLLKSGLNPVYAVRWNPRDPAQALLRMDTNPKLGGPGVAGVYLLDTTTGALTRLPGANPEQHVEALDWLPSGRGIVFVQDSRLYAQQLPGGQPVRCQVEAGPVAEIAVSKDGKWLAYRLSGTPANGYHGAMFAIPSDCSSGAPVPLAVDDMPSFDWSPDGRRLAYTTVGVPGRNLVRVVDVPAGLRDREGDPEHRG